MLRRQEEGFLHLADRGLVFDCFSKKQQSARVMETFDVYFSSGVRKSI